MRKREKRKNIGRPVANAEEGVKSMVITMRTTPRTHQKLHEAAAAQGLSLTEWLVGLGVRAAERQRKADLSRP
jgi:predicted HicB family RNase H-like nuclease